MLGISFVMVILLAVVSAACLAMRRSALRRERAESALSDRPAERPASLSLLREDLQRRGRTFMSGRGRSLIYIAAGLLILLITRNPIIALLPWPAAAVAQRLLEARRRRGSLHREEEQVLEFIDSLSQSLRSGLSLRQSMEVCLEDVGEEMRREILEVLKELHLGGGLEEALTDAAASSSTPSLKLTLTVLALLHGKGGDLPRILERVRKRVAEGLEVRREARILTSQSRASGYLVSSLPPVFLGLQAVLNPRSLRPLFTTPMGNLIIAAAAGLNIAAFFLIRKIVDPGG